VQTIKVMDIPRIHPSGVTLTNSKTSVTISWNEISSDFDIGYSPITSYNIYQDSSIIPIKVTTG